MSSILEALKKLEEEKAARRSGIGNLAGKVAKPGRRQRQTPAWVLPGGMLAVAIVSILITYSAIKGFSPKKPEADVSRLQVTPAPLRTSSGPTAETAPTSTAPGENSAVPLPGPQGADETSRFVAAPARLAPAMAPRTNNRSPDRPAPPEQLVSEAPPLSLTVSGIAWQKDNINRMAVVNSTPMREGGMVAGATVKEILPDRVRFSLGNKEFDVFLEK